MMLSVFARALTRQTTGRGFVARELTRALLDLRPPPDIFLFASENPFGDRVRFRTATGSNPLSSAWRLLRGISRDVRAFRPDAFWGATHVLPSGLPDDLPTVATLHDVVWRDCPETMSARHRAMAAWHERNLERVDRIVCVSEFTRSRVAAHWPHLAAKADVVLHAANPRLRRRTDAAPYLREKFGLEGPFFLAVDTLEPRKNLHILVDAFERVPGSTLVVCGATGWKVGDLLGRMERSPRVKRLGYVDEEDLAALYSEASAAVFPSRYEGFHLSALDALSIGCPVLASDIPAHREVLGDAAAYFPLDSVDALADLMRARVAPSRRDPLGPLRAALFSWDRSAARLLEIIEDAILRRRREGP